MERKLKVQKRERGRGNEDIYPVPVIKANVWSNHVMTQEVVEIFLLHRRITVLFWRLSDDSELRYAKPDTQRSLISITDS